MNTSGRRPLHSLTTSTRGIGHLFVDRKDPPGSNQQAAADDYRRLIFGVGRIAKILDFIPLNSRTAYYDLITIEIKMLLAAYRSTPH
jgi:hypothetical protein